MTLDLNDHLYRFMPAPIRAEDGDGDHLGVLDIGFARFNVFNEIDSVWEGRFLERLARGAFTKTMGERAQQIRALFDHGYDPSIGNKVIGPISEMGERDEGPYGFVPIYDTSYNRDLLPGFRDGQYGASYRFRPVKEHWDDEPTRSEHNPDGIPERTILEVKLYEFGPVTFPADPGTSVGLRSMTDHYVARMAERQGLDLSALQPLRSTGAAATADEPPEGTPTRSHMTREQAHARLLQLRKAA